MNSDLATLTDTDATVGSDPITLQATDSFNNGAASQTIAVTANGLPVIAVPGAQTLGFNEATAISGVSLSESGNTAGRDFHGDVGRHAREFCRRPELACPAPGRRT